MRRWEMNITIRNIFKGLLFGALLTVTLGVGTGVAQASLSFLPGNTFSGTAPVGSVTASFTDVSPGVVQLVITSNLAAGENLDPGKALYFNINPSKDSILGNLSFALTGDTMGFSQAAVVSTVADAFKADGDGKYDILFTFHSSTKAFTTGESQTYLITTTSGTISASDFTNYLSLPAGGNGPFLAAIHVQNTSGGGAWVAGTPVTTTPIPAAAWLLGSGLVGLVGIRRKMRQ